MRVAQVIGPWLVSLLSLAVVAYLALSVLAFLLADAVLFQPQPASYAAGTSGITRVPVAGDDSIAVLQLPNPAVRFTILYSHGNAEDLGDVLPILGALHSYGFAVVAYDYRGYGRSSGGRPTTRKAIADAEAAYGFTVRSLGVAPERLILLGRSVGSGPAVHLASRYQVAGLILESAFTSPYRVLTRVGILPFERFPNLARMPGIRCPVLVIHGTRDEVIPFAHGRALMAAATSRKQSLWVDGAGHNDLFQVAGPRYAEALQRFARSIEE